jgi:hypothetical protein
MLRIKSLFVLAAMIVILSSCQRVIDVSVANSGGQLVIEGNLTDKTGVQTVTLSKSVPYSNSNVFPPVSAASVIMVDDVGNNYTFTEKQSGSGIYTINNFKGKYNHLYFLNVRVDGVTYTAASLMPEPVALDSLTINTQYFGAKNVSDVAVNYKDIAGIPNQYRFIMYVNSVQVNRIFVENDNITDGRAVSSILFERETDLNHGDRVEVEMQCIDASVYNYFHSLSTQNGNSPVDSSTPANPPSNFNNNALGYFSAHTAQRKSIIVP